MTCELWREQIGAYVDGELASSHEAEIAGHLRACADCNAFAAESLRLKRATAQAGRRYQSNGGLRDRVLDSISGRPSRWRPFWRQLAVAAALVIAFVAGVFAARGRGNDVNQEIADIHLNAVASANPVDVVSSDMHTVKPWFQGKVPFTFNLPELANAPYTLLGGRVVYTRGTPCVQLLFQYGLHRISTLIGPAAVLGEANGQQTLANGFHLVRFENGRYAFVTIGDPAMEIVSDLAQRVRVAQ